VIIAPIVVTVRLPGQPLGIGLIVAMLLCVAALAWAIWQSKREGESMVGEPEAAPAAAKRV
jgi:K(+)-stimulated pyrophosphate-energized sodium pump